MNWIEYRDLPAVDNGFSPLFLDYLEYHERIRPYFSGDVRDAQTWRARLDEVASRSLPRSLVARILSLQNRDFHCGVRTLANIDLLHNDNTVAVVTGQQVGVFTGSLYTLYKALTVLKLVDELAVRHPDFSFVPVFWLAGEDHDYDEVSSVGLINRTNDFQRVRVGGDTLTDPAHPVPVGTLRLDDDLAPFLGEIEAALSPTEYTPQLLELLRTAYQPGMTLNRSFVHMMNDLLEDSGMIFLDPNDRDLKQLLVPVFRRELEHTPRVCQLVIDSSAELELRYHAQVKPKPVNLFLLHHEGRYLIEPRPAGFGLKGTRQHFSVHDLLQLLEHHPEFFSPNVVLRPICQDVLLPTLCYVAGPSEVAYFAQLKGAYEEFGLRQPLLYPRASATLVEEKVTAVLDRYHLTVPEFFQDVEFIKRRVAAELSTLRLDEMFGGTRVSLAEIMQSLAAGLKGIDPTLQDAADTAARKIGYQIQSLEQKAAAAQVRRNEAALRQIDKASAHLFPSSNFQERELNVVHFLNRYGLEFLRWLRSELAIDRPRHQVIRL